MQNTPERGTNFTREEIEKTRARNGLLAMALELSLTCNLKCSYCFTDAGRKLENEMTMSEIQNVVDQGLSLGVRKITIIGGGEPLLYPGLKDVIRYIHGKNISVAMFTNGTYLNESTARELHENEVAVILKMNSLEPKTHDLLVGVDGAHARLMEGLRNLLDSGYDERRNNIYIENLICRQNISELPEMWRWIRENRFVPYLERVIFQGRARSQDIRVTTNELRELFQRIARMDGEEFGITWNPDMPFAARNCDRHNYSCYVTAQGYVQPCSSLNIHVGNIRHNSLRDILDASPVIRALRDIKNTIKGDCRTCTLHAECYGCRAQAHQITGDFLEADPYCWNNSRKVI